MMTIENETIRVRMHTILALRFLFALFALTGFSLNAYAEADAVVYDRYALSASAETDIDNDQMTVEMVVEDEDKDSAALADRINQNMLWALLQLEKFPAIKSSTRNYTTRPQYEQSHISGWRSSQTLQLQGSDFEEIKNAIAILQERLIVRSMHFEPRQQTRREIEDRLISEALEAFRQRAELVRNSMQAEKFRVISLNINTNDYAGPVYRDQVMTMSTRAATPSVAAPAVDAGTSRVQVSVHGEIQLQ
ncbi:MAG: SIMPL domain-containing protein [Gammaproteobacteria bacterium]|nr:SIMPL domain-containing protein [Gammaproteobacteria bacterium]